MMPRINLRSPSLLCGLCYRCLAADADPADAPVTRRRLEDLKAGATELALQLSQARADLGIARDKAASSARELEDARVDVKLFNEQHPAPPERRGLLGRRPGQEDPQVRSRRTELDRLLGLARESADRARGLVASLTEKEEQLGRKLGECQTAQRGLAADLRSQHVAATLAACAAGDWPAAESHIGDLRQALRGDLSIAVLTVIASLLKHGAAGGRQAVLESSTLFENHPPQARRVVEALLAFVEGAKMGRNELGLVLPGQLEWDGLYLLHQCIAAMSGWQTAAVDPGTHQARTIDLLAASCPRDPGDEAAYRAAQAQLRNTAAAGDVVVRVLSAYCALTHDEPELALECTGVDTEFDASARGQDAPPGLREQVAAFDFPAWPEVLRDQWRTILCCQVLLAARGRIGAELFSHWLAESYGWPKSDFYWWTLAQVKDDASLLQNISGDSADPVHVARI